MSINPEVAENVFFDLSGTLTVDLESLKRSSAVGNISYEMMPIGPPYVDPSLALLIYPV